MTCWCNLITFVETKPNSMSQLNHFPFLAIFLILISCGGGDNAEIANSGYENNASDALDVSTSEKSDETVSERKLIKTGNISFKTSSIDSTRRKILDNTKKFGGYIASDTESKSTGRFTNTITVRVPNHSFEPLLDAVSEGVEAFDSKDISVEDVTEEFVDAEARVKTKKELELRYHELMKEAKNVTEMLEIEEQIGELRTEIESIEGRLKYLTSQVSYSTLTITFYEEFQEQNGWADKFANSFSQGWDSLIYFFIGLTAIWPFLIMLTIGLLILRRYLKKQN